jgi:regulator of cell morphogenesis and NO signaling
VEELMIHMVKEEKVLFPAIKNLHNSKAISNIPLEEPIAMMEHEHEQAGILTKSIRQLTHHYTVPRDACPTFALLYKKLEEFDQDLMQHIHLENNVLFKKVRSLAD